MLLTDSPSRQESVHMLKNRKQKAGPKVRRSRITCWKYAHGAWVTNTNYSTQAAAVTEAENLVRPSAACATGQECE